MKVLLIIHGFYWNRNYLQQNIILRQLGIQPYTPIFQAMHNFTNQRSKCTLDELWLVQHESVFTKGQQGKEKNILIPGDIPVVQSDRGGEVTYHGPGQQIMYFLVDIKRKKIGVRQLVTAMEKMVINTLAYFGIKSNARTDAPGVYVSNQKICSLGLRIRKGISFHGIALNVSMDLDYFHYINPCGYVGMQMTQVSDFIPGIFLKDIHPILIQEWISLLRYQLVQYSHGNKKEYF